MRSASDGVRACPLSSSCATGSSRMLSLFDSIRTQYKSAACSCKVDKAAKNVANVPDNSRRATNHLQRTTDPQQLTTEEDFTLLKDPLSTAWFILGNVPTVSEITTNKRKRKDRYEPQIR